MPEVDLTTEQHNRLVDLIARRAGVLAALDRQNLLEAADLSEFVTKLDFTANAEAFSAQLIRILQNRGTLNQTGQPALVSLLRVILTIVEGHEDEAAFVASLLIPYEGKERTPGGQRYNLFVSYRRKTWAFTHRMGAI